MHKNVSGTLASAVADAGTFTVGYPAGTRKGDFYAATGHTLVFNNNDKLTFPDDFDVTLGTSTTITITNKTGATWPADSDYTVSLQVPGVKESKDSVTKETLDKVVPSSLVHINLSNPVAIDVDGICAAQAVAGAANATINGALASGGAVTLDVARAVQIDSSDAGDTTQTVTVTGTDVYGRAMSEAIAANGTTAVSGKKAFKTITQVAVSAAYTGNLTVGTTDILGLPVFLPNAGHILGELTNGAVPTAGTVVAGIVTAGGSTATTGDVRGTYLPNQATDGSKVYQIIVSLPDPTYLGIAQA